LLLVLGVYNSSAEALSQEKWWISRLRGKYKSLVNKNDGGAYRPVGRAMSVITRAKLSAALTGRRLSEETRAKIGDALRGRPGKPHTEEARAKMSAAHIGKTVGEEARRRLSVAGKGRPKSAEHKAKISLGLRRAWTCRRA